MIAIQEQAMVEVTVDSDGEITIRQQVGMEDSHYVCVWPENVDALIAALHQAKAEGHSNMARAIEAEDDNRNS